MSRKICWKYLEIVLFLKIDSSCTFQKFQRDIRLSVILFSQKFEQTIKEINNCINFTYFKSNKNINGIYFFIFFIFKIKFR